MQTQRTAFKFPLSQPKEMAFYKAEITKVLNEGIKKAEAHYKTKIPFPTLTFTELRGTTAGTADSKNNKINFNFAIMWRNWDEFIARTVIHELSHLITNRIYGPQKDSHGIKWQMVQILLGGKVEKCHNYDVSHTGTMVYKCGCLNKRHNMDIKLYVRILKGVKVQCPKCKCYLKREVK